MNLRKMDIALRQLAESPCLSSESKQAARRAKEMLEGVMTLHQLDWSVRSDDLYVIVITPPPSPPPGTPDTPA